MKLVIGIALLGAVACTNDPIYVDSDPAEQLEFVEGDPVTTTLNLPFDNEYLNSTEYGDKREELLAELNARPDVEPDLALDQLPLVRMDQLDVSIEWSIRNLTDEPGQAFVDVNGGNQYFYYVPANFIIDPNDDEEPPPPPLAGHVPIQVPAGGEVSGVFREDSIREAALDLDLITRGTFNPFYATLNNNEDIHNMSDVPFVPYPPPEDGAPPPPQPPAIPIEAFGAFVRLDVTFEADRHMVLEYAVRVRDPDGLLHDELLDAPAGELMVFTPAEFVPVLTP